MKNKELIKYYFHHPGGQVSKGLIILLQVGGNNLTYSSSVSLYQILKCAYPLT